MGTRYLIHNCHPELVSGSLELSIVSPKLPSVQSLLKKYGIFPKKRLGQHFLAAAPTIEKIVAALNIAPEEFIIEIGSGLGVMTGLIAKKAHQVFAVEHDASLLCIAKKELVDFSNITWIESDILKLSIPWVMSDHKQTKTAVIGNLPYNISSPIIFWMLENRQLVSRAIIMIQKEVAARIVAKPGNKDYGILSVILQAYADCKKLFNVSAASFIPPPKVQSAVVKLDFQNKTNNVQDEDVFKKIVKGAFGKRRKTLRNALLGAANLNFSPKKLDALLLACDIDGKRRPETLSVEEFIKLANRYA